jgi:vancomycin resistance protein YoaR
MYAALLEAGIPAENITRLAHRLTVDYIEPGLDAMVAEDAYDLRFANPFGNTLAIYAVKEGSVVTVAIAGNREDKSEKNVIRTQIVQKSSPPVYYVENRELEPGEQIVLDPGKAGVTVRVYRNDELVSTDTYEAESSIVQIGPEPEPDTGNK